jgi:hypothetical protein
VGVGVIEGAGVFAGVGVMDGVSEYVAAGTGVLMVAGVATRISGVGVGSVGADAQPARASISIRSRKAIGRMGRIVPDSGSCANQVFVA